MKEILTKHIDACMAELRGAVEREFAAMLAQLAPQRPQRPATRVSCPRRVVAAPVTRERVAGTVALTAGRPCGCGPRGRHRRECDERNAVPRMRGKAKAVPEPVKSPTVARVGTGTDSPRIKPPLDESRAQRFARIEASAKARTSNGGASA